jgi:hypothetical protein
MKRNGSNLFSSLPVLAFAGFVLVGLMGAGNTPVGDKLLIDVNANAHSLTNVASVLGTNGVPLSIPSTNLDTDGTLAANSNTRVPSQAAVVTYVASHASGGSSGLTTQTGTYYANAGDRIFNSLAGGLDYVYLPATPNDGDMVTIYDAGSADYNDESSGFDQHPCTVDANGSIFKVYNGDDDDSSTLSLAVGGSIYIFIYSAEASGTPGWTMAVIASPFFVSSH